ncbi:LEM-3-like GIY-YIG domain-containing protein [Pasteurellaceae bacterium 22721_9_1]
MFSISITEKINYYIYCLVDPRDQNIFYVGKGKGNRVFQHAKGVLTGKAKESEKIELIKDIYQIGLEPLYYILRHNIQTESQALEYEALAIDLLSLVKPNQQPLTNIQGGTHSSEKGLMSLSELKNLYDPQELKTDLPIVLITINRNYNDLKRKLKSGEIKQADIEQEIYNRTRGYWKMSQRREKVKYAVAVYRGWTLAVYEISHWVEAPIERQGRWGFEGKILPKDSPIYQELVDKLTYSSNEDYKAPQNPITYRNC